MATERNIQEGEWYTLTTKEEHEMLGKYGRLKKDSWGESRVQKTRDWTGPGKYYVLRYSQSCPRGCCFDSVVEVLTAEQATDEMGEALSDVADLIRAGRSD